MYVWAFWQVGITKEKECGECHAARCYSGRHPRNLGVENPQHAGVPQEHWQLLLLLHMCCLSLCSGSMHGQTHCRKQEFKIAKMELDLQHEGRKLAMFMQYCAPYLVKLKMHNKFKCLCLACAASSSFKHEVCRTNFVLQHVCQCFS